MKNKKRILFLAQSAGGVENYIEQVLSHIDKDKFHIILICSKDYKISKFYNLVDHIEIINLIRNIHFIKDLKSIYIIRKRIIALDPDIIYLHSSKAGAIGRLACFNIKKKIIYNPHGWSFNMRVSFLKKNLYVLIERFLACFSDKIIAISPFEKKSALDNKICKESKISLINNGIDIEKVQELVLNTQLKKSDLSIPEDAYIIGMVGRISKQKAPDIFVKAAMLIKNKLPNAYFIIVGDGEDKPLIDSLIDSLNLKQYFLITGWVQDPYKYINLFDQALLLSRWEGFGLVLAEYMICRKAIIASNVDAIPYIIRNNENGLLVEVDDIKNIVETILELANNDNKRNRLITNGYKVAIKEFNIHRVVKQHESLFDSILNK